MPSASCSMRCSAKMPASPASPRQFMRAPAAIRSSPKKRRRKLHAAVAQVIEAAHAGNLDRQAPLLAHHWEEAADHARAVRWHRRAAEWAGASDPIEGMRHWRKVRDLGASLRDQDVKES